MEETEGIDIASRIGECAYNDRYFFALSNAIITIKAEFDYIWKMHVRDKHKIFLYEYLALSLINLAGDKGMTRPEIAKAMGISPGTSCSIMEKTGKEGLVKLIHVKVGADRFILTDEGQRVLKEVGGLVGNAFAALEKLMCRHDMDTIIDIGIDVASKATRKGAGSGKRQQPINTEERRQQRVKRKKKSNQKGKD